MQWLILLGRKRIGLPFKGCLFGYLTPGDSLYGVVTMCQENNLGNRPN